MGKKNKKKTSSQIVLDNILQSEENVKKNININLGKSFKNINSDIEYLIKEIYDNTSGLILNKGKNFKSLDDQTKTEIRNKIEKLPIKNQINKITKEYEEISIYNKRNLINFLDEVVNPVMLNRHILGTETSFNIIYYKYGIKQLPLEIILDEEKKEDMNSLTDWKFTLNEILKAEGVFERFKELTLEEIRKYFDIDIKQSYIYEKVIYKKGFEIEKGKNNKPRNGPPYIDSVNARVKISKRLSKKILDAIIGIDPIPLNIYEKALYKCADKKYHQNPEQMSDRQFNKLVEKIHDYLCDIKTGKKDENLFDERIPKYIDDMLGTNRREDYIHEGIGSVVEGHKVYGISKSILGSDMYGARIVFKDEDSIDKFIRGVASYFEEEDYTSHFTHNPKRKKNETNNGIVDIKDYREHAKANEYRGVHVKIRHNSTLIELQLRTKKDDEIAEKREANHKKYKFLQRLRREVRLYENPIDQKLFYAVDYLFSGLR